MLYEQKRENEDTLTEAKLKDKLIYQYQ